MGDAHHDGASIGEQIIDTVRDGDAVESERKSWSLTSEQIDPTRAGVLEVADEFAFFGVDANDRQAAALKAARRSPR